MQVSSDKYLAPDVFCITSENNPAVRHEEQVARMIEGGARYIQLSDRTLKREEFLLTAERCATICRWAGVFFSIDGWPDLAAKVRPHSVHLLPHDPSTNSIRTIVGNEILIGRTVYSLEDLEKILQTTVDYVALGPIFPSASHPGQTPLGLESVQIANQLMEHDHRPLLLFGGITIDQLPVLKEISPHVSLAIQTSLVKKGAISSQVKQYRQQWTLFKQTPSCYS